MQLFMKENRRKTIQNSKEFLKKFPKLMLKAGISTSEVNSPSFGQNFSSGSFSNSNENKLVNQLEYKEQVAIVMKCIKLLKHDYSVVLIDLYINELTLDECSEHTSYARTSISKIRNRALIDFAFAMEGYGYHLVFYYKN